MTATRKRTFPGIGSVSSGTMRTEDLLSTFADLCRDYGGKRGTVLYREYTELPSFDDMDDTQLEDAELLLEEMTGILESIAPDFVHFGASEGDGADYGFWPSLESLEDATRGRDAEVLKVGDTSQVPREWIGHVMQVSDHGNVTLYWKSARKLTELWSCV